MIFVDLAAWIIFIFLSCYVVLQFYITSSSSRGRLIDIGRRSYNSKFDQNLTVIVYSHNNSATIIDLIEALKKQEYDPEKYSINIILDNCDDNSAKLLEILGGTRLWRISTDVKPIGRYKAIAWLLERILTSENTNAFIFLNGDCIVKPNFLSKINFAIQEKPVLIGNVLPQNHYPGLITSIINAKNKLINKVIKHGRYYASLGNTIEGELLAIRQEVLEKIKLPVTDYGFEEYEYSVKLAQAKIPVGFSNEFCVFRQFSDTFKTAAVSIYKRRYKNFLTFKNNFALLFKRQNFRTKELLISLAYPSSTMFFILSFILLYISLSTHSLFSRHIGGKTILLLIFAYVVSKVFSMLVARFSFSDYKNSISSFFISPFIFFTSILLGFKINIPIKFNFKKKTEEKDYEKKIIEAIITDGKKELSCQLEIRQNMENSQVIFLFKDKKLASLKHPRLDHALDELLEKLKTHGFALKICMNCGYFDLSEPVAARFAGEQGYCLYNNVNNESKSKEYSYIWNSCPNIIPSQVRNHILSQLGKNNPK